jgi:hypothetical protein
MSSSHDQNRRSFLLALSTSLAWLSHVASSLADDLLSIRKARRRVAPLCSIPPADYQWGARSPSKIVRSLPAVPQYDLEHLEDLTAIIKEQSAITGAIAPNLAHQHLYSPEELQWRSEQVLERRLAAKEVLNEAVRPKAKLFQLPRKEIVIAHCMVSDVTLLVEAGGQWHLSLRGDQNYYVNDLPEQRNVELHMRRNAFNVTFRLLRSSRRTGENITPLVGEEPSFDQAGKLAYVEICVPEFWVQREAPQIVLKAGQSAMIAQFFDDLDQAEFEFFIRLDSLTGSGEGVVQPWQPERLR